MNDVLELFDLEPNHHLAVREGGKVRVRQVSDRVVRALRWNVDFWDPVPHASIQAWNARFGSAPRGRLAPYEAMSGLSVIDRDARWAALCDGGVRRTPAEFFSLAVLALRAGGPTPHRSPCGVRPPSSQGLQAPRSPHRKTPTPFQEKTGRSPSP